MIESPLRPVPHDQPTAFLTALDPMILIQHFFFLRRTHSESAIPAKDAPLSQPHRLQFLSKGFVMSYPLRVGCPAPLPQSHLRLLFINASPSCLLSTCIPRSRDYCPRNLLCLTHFESVIPAKDAPLSQPDLFIIVVIILTPVINPPHSSPPSILQFSAKVLLSQPA